MEIVEGDVDVYIKRLKRKRDLIDVNNGVFQTANPALLAVTSSKYKKISV